MKRSEMLNNLAKYLVKRDQHISLTIEMARTVAKHALRFVEKEGMLPPFYSPGIRIYKLYEWEPEDEEK